jgi:hypothetical protein
VFMEGSRRINGNGSRKEGGGKVVFCRETLGGGVNILSDGRRNHQLYENI